MDSTEKREPRILRAEDEALEVHRLKGEVRRHAEELDGLVIARTRELEEANERLREEIMERQRAEEALRESEARARALLATVPDMMFRVRRDGTYLEFMPGRGTKPFASPEDFLGKTISDVMPADLAKREMQDIGRALDTGEVVEHEYKLLMGDELLTYEYRLASCGDDEVFALVRDITDRKRADHELRGMRDQLQLSIDLMPVGYILLDLNGTVSHWNPAAERIFGFTSEEAVGSTLLELVVPEEVRPAVTEVLDRLAAGEEASYSEPGNNVRKDGSVITCQWFNTPLIDATGEVSGVLSMALDVTERQRAEEAVREANTIINLSPAVAFLWKNEEGRPVEYVSGNVEDLLGYTAQEFMSGDVSYTSIIHADDLETALEQNRKYFKEKNRDRFSQEYRIVTKDGQVKWVDDRTRKRRNEEGVVTHHQGIVLDITDRKRAEEALKEQHERTQLILETSMDGFFLADTEGRLLDVNPSYCRMVGYSRDELVGMNVLHLVREPAPVQVGERIQRILRDGSARFETQHRHKQGSFVDLDVSAFAMRPQGGAPLLAAFVRDTTERKTVEACLYFVAQRGWTEHGEGFLKALVTHLGETLGVEYAFIDELLPGGERARTMGFYAAGEVVPDVEYDLEHTPCRRVMDGELCSFPRDVQQRFSQDQMLVDMGVEGYAAIPLWGSSGDAIGLVAVMDTKPIENPDLVARILQIVAVRAASELEHKRAEEALRASEQHFRGLFEHVPVTLWEEDFSDVFSYLEDLGFREIEDFPEYLEQRPDVVAECLARVGIIAVNHAALALHGAETKEELLGNLTRSFTARNYAGFRKALVAMWRGEDFCETDADLRTMSGAIRETILRWSVPPGGDGSYSSVLVSVSDVTELETARTKLREMNVELERLVEARTRQLTEANRELEAFAYSVSHDLKAPLRAIDGYSGMLEERHESSLPDDGQRLLGVVRSNAKQMARLIDDLLAFSRIGRVEMVISDVDMRELARTVFSDLSRLEGDRTVDFSLGELPTVPGDVALLRQVWTNLLENALKFSGEREAARIEVDCQEEPDHWVFRVRDNGAGFDMEYVDKLFGVFQRLHYQEEFRGTGVGLATVQRIVQRHGGEVWAEGEVDVGATLFFRLRRASNVT